MMWVDALTSSEKRQTWYIFGIRSAAKTSHTKLYDWITSTDNAHDYDWRHISGTGFNVWGGRVSRGHDYAPPIWGLRGFVDPYVDRSSDSEIYEFVETMRTGSREEQMTAVNAAWLKVSDVVETRLNEAVRPGSTRN